MAPIETVRRSIAELNAEITLESSVEIGLGVVYALLTWAVIFWLTWIASFCVFRGWGLGPGTTALLVTLLFAGASTFEAWRRVDPLADLEPMDETEEFVMVLSFATPSVVVVNPRRAVAGFAWLILGGPVNVFSGIEALRHRLPTDERTIQAAAGLLEGAERGVAVESISEPLAAIVLRRLLLIRHEQGRGKGVIVLTEKGRSLLRARSGP